MNNADVAALLFEMADLLELSGDASFRPVSYRRAARAVEQLAEEVADVARRGELAGIPGVGAAIAAKIEEALQRGVFRQLEELRARVPPGLVEFLAVPGLGPKTAALIHQRLGIVDLDALEEAARRGLLRNLPGMGEKREANILAGLRTRRERAHRFLLHEAWALAEEIAAQLRALPAALEVAIAGSVRRCRETVGDIDLVASSERPGEVMEHFAKLPHVAEVLSRGPTKTSVLTRVGCRVDLRVVRPEQFAAALHHFTGSKEHNVRLRGRARGRGLRINEYGVFRVTPDAAGTEQDVEGAEDGAPARSEGWLPLPIRAEADVYAAVDLPHIPPELREDRGEIEAAEAGRLPALIEVRDIRGDLHLHSRWSDGRASIGEMARAGRELGYEYIAVADHSRSLVVAGGLDAEGLRRQGREIEQVNAELDAEAAAGAPPFTVLRGVEVDILKDGRLDLPDDVLAELEVVVASVHSSFRADEKQMTDRLEAALKNPHVDVIGHLTGRLLTRREGYPLDLERVIDLAARTGTALEVNGSPERLDAPAPIVRRARDGGVRLAISSDAHSTAGLAAMRFGVCEARRGWIEARDVINARPLAELRRLLKR